MKKLVIILMTAFMLFGIAVPIFAEEAQEPEKTEEQSNEQQENTTSTATSIPSMKQGIAAYNEALVQNHKVFSSGLSIDVDIKDLYSTFTTLKNNYDANLISFDAEGAEGTMAAFNEETQTIMKNLEQTQEAMTLQNKINDYKTNSSGWITAPKDSNNKSSKATYKNQKSADKNYIFYQQKYDEAIKNLKGNASKEDLVSTGNTYPEKIDKYQQGIALRASGDAGSSTIKLEVPEIDGIALSGAVNGK